MHVIILHPCITIPGGLLLARHFRAFPAKSDMTLLFYSETTGLRMMNSFIEKAIVGALQHRRLASHHATSRELTWDAALKKPAWWIEKGFYLRWLILGKDLCGGPLA